LEILNNEIDATIDIHYIVGKNQEQNIADQVCVDSLYPEKIFAFTACLNTGQSSEECLTEAQISLNQINLCIDNDASIILEEDRKKAASFSINSTKCLC